MQTAASPQVHICSRVKTFTVSHRWFPCLRQNQILQKDSTRLYCGERGWRVSGDPAGLPGRSIHLSRSSPQAVCYGHQRRQWGRILYVFWWDAAPTSYRRGHKKRSIPPLGQQIQILSADILKGLLGIPVQRRKDFFFKYFSAASKFNGASVRCCEGIPEAEHAVRYPVRAFCGFRILGNGNDLVTSPSRSKVFIRLPAALGVSSVRSQISWSLRLLAPRHRRAEWASSGSDRCTFKNLVGRR